MLAMEKNVIHQLPQVILPESWFQDKRMNAMFAEFRNQLVNPQDWNTKYQFWKELIFKWLSYNKKCQFSISELTFAFKRNESFPRCLPTVIEELIKSNEIVTEDHFHYQLYNPDTSWTSWTINIFIKKPFLWSLCTIKHFLNFNNNYSNYNSESIKYINLKMVDELANNILSFTKTQDIIILPLFQILQKCAEEKNIDEHNAKLALMWINKLKKNNLIINFNQISFESLLKISFDKGIEKLSTYEEGLFQLTQCEKSIFKNIQNIEKEKYAIITEIEELIQTNNNVIVKTLLRKRKQLEKRIEKQTAIFDNIQILLSNIHDAKSHSEVFQTYQKSNEILKHFKLCPLQVQNTMDDLYEVIDELNETQLALTESYQQDQNINLELEEEFQNLFINSSSADIKILPKEELSDNNDLHFPQVPKTCTPHITNKEKSLA